MRSMTGFGYASGEANGRRCIVEMRSFNHRFFDLKLRLPTLWADPLLEQLIGQSLRKTVNRGSLIVSIREDGPMTGRHAVNVDPELGRAYGKALLELWQALRTNLGEGATDPAPDELASELGIDTQHRLLTLVAAQPGVLSVGEAGMDAALRQRKWAGWKDAVARVRSARP